MYIHTSALIAASAPAVSLALQQDLLRSKGVDGDVAEAARQVLVRAAQDNTSGAL